MANTSNKTNKKKLKVVGMIAGIMAAVLLLGAVAGGFGILKLDKDKAKDVLLPAINPDNYYSKATVTLEDMNDGNGVVVKVDERTGAVTLDGKAETDLTYEIGTVKLDAAKEYTGTAIKGGSKASVYVAATYGETSVNFDFVGNTFEIAEDETVVTLTIHISEGTELDNLKVLPTIVKGDEAGSFYE